MREERTQRRLSAILAADVVGYGRLMEQDETNTFDRLRAHRTELFEPEIAAHRGRVFKLMGDGLLAEWLPNSERSTIPGVGHFLQMQDPRPVADSLTTFFSRYPMT